jgi:ABC-type transport system involved in multi-copper enzyme maturation permease subunit
MNETTTAPAVRAPGFWRAVWIIAALELRQRRRSKTLWILGVVWFVLIGVVTGVTWYILAASFGAYDEDFDAYPLFSLIVYFVLLFGTLVAPAISAGSIGSERSGGTLATTQVTLVSTWSILVGKALAAWITGIAFLVVALPFVVLSLTVARFDPLQLLIAVLALALQIGLFTAIGVGLSAFISSQLFSIVTAYLIVALLSVGTLIAFGLAIGSTTKYVEVEYRTYSQEYWEQLDRCYQGPDDEAAIAECEREIPVTCTTERTTTSVVHTDRLWWILAMNPYVIVGDMVSVRPDDQAPSDLFSLISYGVRSMQKPQDSTFSGWDDCRPGAQDEISDDGTLSDDLEGTVPVWWIGLALQVGLAAASLGAGYVRLRTPARRLPKGSRIA